jgi:hypothetical protein
MMDELMAVVDGRPATQHEWLAALTAVPGQFAGIPIIVEPPAKVYKPVPTLTRKLRKWREALEAQENKRRKRAEFLRGR